MQSLSQIKKLPSFWAGSIQQTLATLDRPVSFEPSPPRPLVLIPGAFCTSSVMNSLGKMLVDHGRTVWVPPSFAYYYSALANLCRLPRAARDFAGWLDAKGREKGFSEIDVAGHSNGALIAMLAQDMVDRKELTCSVTVKRVLTMATPFGGLPNAKVLASVLPCCKDLVPGCDTLERIARMKHLVVHCLVAANDFLVPPVNQFPEAHPKTVMEDFQHMDFIVGAEEKVARTAEEVMRWLGNSF